MDRRAFLGTAASAGVAASCAPLRVSPQSAPASGCLPRVKVDQGRIIRTVAGLRPYRASGFVVRREALGGQKIIAHNYGHGGAGITLSWGSARLAHDLVTDVAGPAAVIGAGIMGLTTAILAQERGREVTIYAADLPPATTSNIAGGQIHPASHYRSSAVDAAWLAQFRAAMAYSWRRWQIYVGDDYGVRWLPTYDQYPPRDTSPLRPFYPGLEAVTPSPFPVGPVVRYNTMYVETGRCLRQLEADFQRAGGRIEVRRFDSPDQLATLPQSLLFNCTGLGARKLFGDDELVPMRGQLAVLLPEPEVQYAYSLDTGYMFPRADGVLLGGTFERDEWDAVATPEAISGIVAAHRALNSGCAA